MKYLPWLCLAVIVFASDSFADNLTLTTYYPSPSGDYQNLHASGNLGVGTTNPVNPLSVKGNMNIVNGSIGFNRNPDNGSLPPGGNSSWGRYQIAPISDRIEFQAYNSSGASTGAITISAATGCVGIGNSTPSQALDVLGGAYFSGNVGIGAGRTTPAYPVDVTGDIMANDGWMRTSGNKGWVNQTHGGGWYMNEAIWLRVYGSKKVLIDNELNVTGTTNLATTNISGPTTIAGTTNLSGPTTISGATTFSGATTISNLQIPEGATITFQPRNNESCYDLDTGVCRDGYYVVGFQSGGCGLRCCKF